jgi:hypothetical protein
VNRSVLVLLIVSLLLCSGCSSQISQAGNMINPTPVKNTPVKTPTLSPTVSVTEEIAEEPMQEPEPVIATPTPTPVPRRTAEPTPTSAQGYILPDKTPSVAPTPIPVDLKNTSTVNLTRYSDDDFIINYPGSWTVTNETSLSTVARESRILYAVYTFKPDTRVVEFESGEGVSFTATISDFTIPGNFDLDKRIEWAGNTITPRFNDVAGLSHLTNFEVRYTEFKTPYVIFDVIVPEGSVYFPYAYTERDIVSFNHFYTFQFNAERGNLTEYKELKDTMFASLMTEERIKMDQWKEVRR